MELHRILLAFDSYKGCLSSLNVAEAAATALSVVLPGCEVVKIGIADGGEGTVDAVIERLDGTKICAAVSDPLGRPIKAEYGIAGRLAIIESAAACGLTLLKKEERNPLNTTSRGLGELILSAIDHGCTEFIIGLGGSATNDGGRGMVEVPGFLEKARGLKFTVACDVDNPFVGARGASRIFGPQKGASPKDVEVLEKRLSVYAAEISDRTGTDVRNMPGAGAAGGLGGAFKAFLGAELKRGVDMVLDTLRFDELLSGTDLIITGEGCSDAQTLMGKCPVGVLRRAGDIPVLLMSGAVRDPGILQNAGFRELLAVTPEDMDLSEAMAPETAGRNIINTLTGYFSNAGWQ